MNVPDIYPRLPDPPVLAAIGAVTIRHREFEDALRMMLRTLLRQTAEEARTYFARIGPGKLRQRLEELARAVFGPGEVLDQLKEMLGRSERLSAQRNEWVHALYGENWLGEPLRRDDLGNWVEPPTPVQLHELARHIDALTHELRQARATGFLARPLVDRGYNPP